MANKKISELASTTTLTDSDVLPVVNGGTTKKVSVSNLASTILKASSCVLTTTWNKDTLNNFYTQQVSVSGITANDSPILDIKKDGNLANVIALENEWSKVVHAITSTNSITFYASEQTKRNLEILIKGK